MRGWVQWQQAGDQVDVARLTAADVRRTLAVAAGRAYLAVIKERRLLETARTARDNGARSEARPPGGDRAIPMIGGGI